MKKILTVILAMALVVSAFAGCTLVEDDDSNAVIATVNGKNILKSQFDEVYDYYYYLFVNYYGYDHETAVSQLASMATDILDDLIEEEVLRQKAEAAGYFNFTDEIKAEAQEVVDSDRKTYIDSFVSQYTEALKGQEVKGKEDGETDEEYFTRLATDKYKQSLIDSGTSEEQLYNEQLEAIALEKYKEDMLKDVIVDEGDKISYYDELYKEQEQELSSDKIFVSAYNGGSITTSSGSSTTYDMVLYNRPGYKLVQHILIMFDDEDTETLEGYYNLIADYDEEIEGLQADLEVETDETAKQDIQKDIDNSKSERADIQAKYDAALATAKANIQDKTDEVYNSVKDADEAKFIEVLLEKSEDTGMQTEEAAKAGYLVGNEDGMVPEFSKAATALEAGQVSEPVATYYGYHIIRCIKALPEGKVAYEDVKDKITETLTENKKNDEWSKMVTTWTDEATIKKYEKRLDV